MTGLSSRTGIYAKRKITIYVVIKLDIMQGLPYLCRANISLNI